MSTTETTGKAAAAADPGENEEAAEPKSALGRALDVAGIVAAGVLVVIVFDVMSGGKVTRWLQRKRGGPCENCGDQPVAPEPRAVADDG